MFNYKNIMGLTSALALSMAVMPMSAYADQAGIDRASERLASYSEKPVFTAPGEPFDIRACAEGRKMLSMPNSSANPFLKGIINRMKAVGDEIGLEVVEWENQGQPSQWVQGFDFAIRDKFDVINLISGISPDTVEPQVKAATDAGVKVMTSHFYDPSFEPHPLLSSTLPIGFNEIGKILANWVTVNTDGKAKIALIVSREVPPTIPLVDGIETELAENCPDCEIVSEINVGVSEWGTKIQSSLQTVLQANPEIDVVIPIYDSMSQFVVPALRLTGKLGEVKVATFNGTPFVLDFIQQGSVSMNIGESLDWIAYATIDGHMRDLCGLAVPDKLNVPFYIFDENNAADAGTPAQFDTGYGDAYITGFRELWGLN
ncbi:sugar ABC transporter substrate-binding protein [Hoeflea prorocentri]|uniref:Sugar ABC transporter substrate-binding protein n=1 Tax=Hoeflea prorocentri TaxID=1922333 RepID=A0A9X3UN54_9HYPH|nr:sugar ABC transporter substrate-binding protein [Hoeflea prorocentri]MCY6383709.1 sugar ABC transporter substrate-binding protein [Hoeflea prorocentri]MDA5401509.1 sugar ABC transporter substrate-binding protein [Hoeflea prorocentri]